MSEGAPGDLLRSWIGERERVRRRPRDPARDEFFVQVPESGSWLDTASMPMILTAVAVALFAKVLMMVRYCYPSSKFEKKIMFWLRDLVLGFYMHNPSPN